MARPTDYSLSKLSEESDWLIKWMKSMSEMICRTSIVVPDSTAANSFQFATKEMAELPETQEHEQASASYEQVAIRMGTDSTSHYPCKSGFISFDPDANT